MKCRCSNCGWLDINPSGAMFCGYSDERTWENESCLAWKDKDEPQTNADLIRAMTVEELATFLFNNVSCSDCTMHGGGCSVDCEKWMLSWLKAPVICSYRGASR